MGAGGLVEVKTAWEGTHAKACRLGEVKYILDLNFIQACSNGIFVYIHIVL
jgi:hypothetical protein